MSRPIFRHQGFSLIELVITIVVLGIIAGISAIMLSGGINAYLTGERILTNVPAARLAMDRSIRELRRSCDGTVNVIGDKQINFNAPNTECDTPAFHSIRLSGTTLQLQVAAGGTWFPLALNVTQIGSSPLFVLNTDPNSGCQTVTVQFLVTNTNGDSLPVRSAVYLQNQQCI